MARLQTLAQQRQVPYQRLLKQLLEERLQQEVGLTLRAKKVFALAQDEAHLRGHTSVDTGHLLLGLLHDGESIAASVLESLGVTLEQARVQAAHLVARDTE